MVWISSVIHVPHVLECQLGETLYLCQINDEWITIKVNLTDISAFFILRAKTQSLYCLGVLEFKNTSDLLSIIIPPRQLELFQNHSWIFKIYACISFVSWIKTIQSSANTRHIGSTPLASLTPLKFFWNWTSRKAKDKIIAHKI